MKKLRYCLPLLMALLLTGCGDIYSRDDFRTAVVGKSDAEVLTQFGKPDVVDTHDPTRTVWTYKHKTFDLANQNSRDAEADVTFDKPAGGTPHAVSVEFHS